MPRDKIYIGTTPAEEACSATGHGDRWQELQRLESRAYIVALTRKYGEPPEGARFVVAGQPHDFGTYYEVQCSYDSEIPAAAEYAWKTENGLRWWHEVGMWPPVTYDDKGDPVHEITDPELWIRETNPDCHNTKERRDAAAAEKAAKPA